MPNPIYVESRKAAAVHQREAEIRRQRESEFTAQLRQVVEARGTIERALRTYQERIALAQRGFRRVAAASDSESLRYQRTFLTLQTRMSGAIAQALTRACSMDRTLDESKQEAQEQMNAREREVEAQRQATREVESLLLPKSDADDMDLLYGEVEEPSYAQ